MPVTIPKKPLKQKATLKSSKPFVDDKGEVPSEEQHSMRANEEDSFHIDKDDDDFDSHLQKQADRIL